MSHGGLLIADLWRYYGAGPEQLLAQGATVEDVADLAAHLPRESATILAVVPRVEGEAWDVNAHLLAAVVDLLAGANWQRSGGRTNKPNPLPRPATPKAAAGGHEDAQDFREWYAAQPGGRPLPGFEGTSAADPGGE